MELKESSGLTKLLEEMQKAHEGLIRIRERTSFVMPLNAINLGMVVIHSDSENFQIHKGFRAFEWNK